MKAFFSNRVEQLYQFFRQELYVDNNHPFAERLVVVPSPAVKNWLTLRLADDPQFGIAMGLKMGFLDQTLKGMTSFSKTQPSKQALSFTIEALLDKKWKKKELEASVQRYLGDGQKRRGQKRLVQLAEALTTLFDRYGIYAPEMVKKWESDPTLHWQAELWHELFKGDWSYPAALYNESECYLKPNTSIHLFSVSHISKTHHQFLKQLSEKIPVSYYVLSPCQAFWSDVLTDREAGRLETYWRKRGVAEGEQRALEEYLTDRNPLLANYGALGRSMAKLIENEEIAVTSAYTYSTSIEKDYEPLLFPDSMLAPVSHPLTLLEAIQADIGLMRNPEEGLLPEIAPDDASIQIHAAPTMLREVEVVRDLILRSVEKQKLIPEEVLVMAPDISEYAAAIEAVFGAEECPVDFQLLDVGKISGNQEIRLFLQLLDLPTTRWDVISIISLIENEVGFSKKEAEQIIPWLRESGVRWGYTKDDREELLSRDHGDCKLVEAKNRGTWSHAISRLVQSMVLYKPEDPDKLLNEITSSEGDLLGKLIAFLQNLRVDLLPIANQKQTIAEWLIYLEEIIHKYLKISDETREYLFRTFEEMRLASLRMNHVKVPFYSLKTRLQKAFEKKESGYRETHLSAVRFCSMLPMRAIPAKMIVLMGMDEQSFPKKETFSSLDQMRQHRQLCDEMPSQVDYDRFLFLESILSAREVLAMTYISSGKDDPPSVVVTELVDYIQKAFAIKLPTQVHPFHSFHHSLFTNENSFRSYSQRDYRSACVYYGKNQNVESEGFSIRSEHGNEAYIDMDHFYKCIQNPLRNFLRTSLQLKIPKIQDAIVDEEHFELEHLESYQLTKMCLKNDPEQVYRWIHQSEMLPAGVFGELAKQKIESEINAISESKKTLGLTNESFFDLIFTDEVDAPRKEGNQWMLPPLPVMNHRLIGTLSECTEKGIWMHSTFDAKHIAKGIGKYLMYMQAIHHFNLPFQADILFGKAGVRKNLDTSQLDSHFQKAMDLFVHSQKVPSHLLVEWVEPILKQDADKLGEAMEKTKVKSYDAYTAWYMRNRETPSANAIIEECHEAADSIYGTAVRSWIVKEGKNEEL